MNSPGNQTYYLKLNANQVIGPLPFPAIEAMLRANKIDGAVEVSADQQRWMRLNILLQQVYGTQGGETVQATVADVRNPGTQGSWDYRLESGDEQTQLPGRIAPLPGPAKNQGFGGGVHDAPLPGQAAPLPGRVGRETLGGEPPLPGRMHGDVPLPGMAAPLPGHTASAPLPGQAAPLPGYGAPLPGQPAPAPGYSAPYPGSYSTGSGHANAQDEYGGTTEGFNFDQNRRGGAGDAGFGDGGPQLKAGEQTLGAPPHAFGATPYGAMGGAAPGAGAYGGAPATPASPPERPHATTNAGNPYDLQGLGYNVDDLFSGKKEEKESIFSVKQPVVDEASERTNILGASVGGAGAKPSGGQPYGYAAGAGGASGIGGGGIDTGSGSGVSGNTVNPNTSKGPAGTGTEESFAVHFDPSVPIRPNARVDAWSSQGPMSHDASRGPAASYGPPNAYGASNFGSSPVRSDLPDIDPFADIDSLNYSKYTDPRQTSGFSAVPIDKEKDNKNKTNLPTKGKKKVFILVGVAILLLALAGGGVGTYLYLQKKKAEEEALAQKTVEEPAPAPEIQPTAKPDQLTVEQVIAGGPNANTLALEAIAFDNYKDLKRLAANSADGKSDPMWLMSQALLRARYPGLPENPNALKVASQLASANSGVEALSRGAWDASAGAADAARSYLEQVSDVSPVEKYYVISLGGVGDVVALRQYIGNSLADMNMDRINGYNISAQRTLDVAIQLMPDLPFAYFWKGILAELMAKPEEAMAAYKKVLSVQKFHAGAWARLARVYLLLGKLKEADDAAQQVVDKLKAVASPDELSLAHEVLGEVYIIERKWAEGIKELKDAITLNPKNLIAAKTLAYLFVLSDNYQDGVAFFSSANLDQNAPAIILGNARVEIGVGRYDDARKRLDAASKADPTNAQYPLLLGELYEAEGNLTTAQAEFKTALKLDPRLIEASIGLARISWRGTSDREQADEYLSKIKDDLQIGTDSKPSYLIDYQLGQYYCDTDQKPEAINWLRRAIASAPSFVSARVLLAKILAASGQYDEGLQVLNANASISTSIPIRTTIGEILMQKGDLDAARKEISAVLDEAPDNAGALIVMARIALASNDTDGAEKAITDAKKTTSTEMIDKSIAKGLLAEARNDNEQAQMVFDSLIRMRPDARVANYYLGRIYMKLGNRSKAVELLSKYIDAPSYRVPIEKVYLERGNLYLNNSIYKLAQEDFRNALKSSTISNEQRADALLGLSQVAMKEKRFNDAIDLLTRSLDTGVRLGETRFRLGQAYANAGNSTTAIKELNQAKELGYDSPELNRLLAYAYKEQGKSLEAERAFKDYLKTLDPKRQAEEVKEILRQIETL